MKITAYYFALIVSLFCTNLSAQNTTETPKYFQLLKADQPNIYKIMNAYDAYYKAHDWVKNDFTRAYNAFIRRYPMESFDVNGFPITPSDKKLELRENVPAQSFTSEWTALPVRIERSDCYYTGQNGVVRSIGVHPTNASIAIAGGMNGGLWRTTDKGKTWSENLIKNLPYVGLINKIVFAPSNANYVYVASNAGILKSTDGGLSFSMTNIDYNSKFPSIDYAGDDYRSEYMFVDVSSTDENVVIASDINPTGLVSKVARSIDGGATWVSNTTFGYKKFTIDVKFHPTNPTIAYTLVEENDDINFYRSTDGGLNFTRVTTGFANFTNPNNNEIRGKIAVTPAQPDLVAFYLNVYNDGAAFYKSTDAGVNWSRACCGTATGVVNKSAGDRDYFGEGFSAVQIRWATALAISDVDANFVAAATNVQPRFSFDQMSTWYWTGDQTSIASRPAIVMNKDDNCGTEIHGDIQELLIKGNDVWVVNDGGIALSEDGGVTFKERADGMPITMALGFDMTPGERDVIVVAMDHNGVMVRDEDVYGSEWKPLGGGDASGASVNPIDDSWLYARPSGDNIIQRPVSGPSHGHPNYNSAQGLNFGSGYRGRYNNVQVHPNAYYTLYSVDYNNFQVQKSTNNGVTWSPIKSLQSASGYSYAEVKVSSSNPDVIYVSDESNGTNTLDKSINGGLSWTSILPNLLSNEKIRNIEISSTDPDVVWVSVNGSSPKVYKSTNGGSSWTSYSTGLAGHTIYSMVHQKGSDGGVYIGTQDGVYYRDNTKSAWEVFGVSLPGISIKSLKINYPKGIIRAGTGRGIWENSLAESSDPEAMITSDRQSVTCGAEEVQFASNSIISNVGKTYTWTFEGAVPGTSNAVRPTVVYPLAGTFDVTLTVTDVNGTSTQTLTDYITVSGSCTSSAEVAIVNQNGLGSTSCIEQASIGVDIYNKGLPTITNYTLELYYNDQLEEQRNITTSLASGVTETINFDNLDLIGVAKIEFKVSLPNGVSDNITDNSIVSYIAVDEIEVPVISTVSYSSASGTDTPDKMFDGDLSTIWHNNWGSNAPLPHEFVFDLDKSYNISAVEMLNRQNNSNGMLKDVEIFTSTDGVSWVGPYNWTFEATTSWQTANFANGLPFQYFKFVVTSTISGSNVCSIAEMKFKGCNNVITFIDKGASDQSIKIYPNPTSEYIQIEGLKAGMKVRVLNNMGLLVYDGDGSILKVENYASGSYYLQVIDGDKIIVKKWIKI